MSQAPPIPETQRGRGPGRPDLTRADVAEDRRALAENLKRDFEANDAQMRKR